MNKFYDMKKFFKGVITKSLLKKVAAVLTICAIFAGVSAFYHHQDKMERKAAENQARTVIVENFAKENNIALIDTDKVHALVAKTIGVEENSITYNEISLRDFHDKRKRPKKFDGDRPPKPADDNAVENSAENVKFTPVYKVACTANDIRYKIYIDAVSGKVMDIDVG